MRQENCVSLLYYTRDYPKLVEMVARQCYQSFDKVDEKSHSFIRSIISKGHLSVASIGNIVFGVTTLDIEVSTCLLKMKEINNFIRWTVSDEKTSSRFAVIVSMNMLTYLDIKKAYDEGYQLPLFEKIIFEVNQVAELSWFYNREVEFTPKENTYFNLPAPKLYQPVLLTEDYTALQKLGFTEHELSIHATITINYMTDRSTGLQLWRHGDMTGGTELSQRYVNRGNASFREMIEFESGSSNESTKDISAKWHKIIADLNQDYNDLIDEMGELGIHQARAKEVARSILPNAIVTEIIQCRPLRQWLHLFNLRDSNHAQKEAAADVRSIKQLFIQHDVKVND